MVGFSGTGVMRLPTIYQMRCGQKRFTHPTRLPKIKVFVAWGEATRTPTNRVLRWGSLSLTPTYELFYAGE